MAVDATPLLGHRSGIGQFTAGLLHALDARPELTVRRYAVTWRGHRDTGATGWPVPARLAHRCWARFDGPRIERFWPGSSVAVVHGTNYVVPPTSAARVVSVHDLTMVRFPHLCPPATLRFPELVQRAIARGAVVHADSFFVADEIRNWQPAARVRVVHPGIAPVPGSREPRVRSGPPYLLAIGTIEPRKDHPTLVRAFAELATRPDLDDLRLVIVGADGWGSAAFEGAVSRLPEAIRRRIDRRGFVNDGERDALLDGAAAFVYPSVYEGFGIAPLEAMARRVPVVATAAGSLPEILGDAATLVAVGDADALAAGIDLVLADPNPWQPRGLACVAQYSWSAAAEAMSDVYQEARLEHLDRRKRR